MKWLCYLHHEHHGIEGDHGQHSVLEGGRHDKVPDSVLKGLPVLRHVARQGLGIDSKVNAGSLKQRERQEHLSMKGTMYKCI